MTEVRPEVLIALVAVMAVMWEAVIKKERGRDSRVIACACAVCVDRKRGVCSCVLVRVCVCVTDGRGNTENNRTYSKGQTQRDLGSTKICI